MVSLLIGYGNDLRSDDGAGRVVAERVEAMSLPGVRVRSVMQLTPELALEMAGCDRVVFVDASVAVAETTMRAVTEEPAPAGAMTHQASPGALLGMVRTMGTTPPEAVVISIPVTDLALGMELTPMTEIGVEQAVEHVLKLVAA